MFDLFLLLISDVLVVVELVFILFFFCDIYYVDFDDYVVGVLCYVIMSDFVVVMKEFDGLDELCLDISKLMFDECLNLVEILGDVNFVVLGLIIFVEFYMLRSDYESLVDFLVFIDVFLI